MICSQGAYFCALHAAADSAYDFREKSLEAAKALKVVATIFGKPPVMPKRLFCWSHRYFSQKNLT